MVKIRLGEPANGSRLRPVAVSLRSCVKKKVDKQTIPAALILLGVTCGIAAEANESVSGFSGSPDRTRQAPFGGPGSVASQIRSDERPKDSVFDAQQTPDDRDSHATLKERMREDHDLVFGLDYNMLIQHASASLGEQDAAGGALRFFGSWAVLGPETGNPGSIAFKVENRHRLGTDIAPQALAGEFGYAGLTALPFSYAGTLLTNLYWQQSLNQNRVGYVAGIVDTTDYVGVYGLVNPWTDFINLVFSTDPTIPAPDQGLGAAVRWSTARQFYVLAGIADANADPGAPLNSIETFFDEGESFKHLEVGRYVSWDTRIEDNIHLTLWQVDERTEAGIADGWGAAFSYSNKMDERWLPFLRLGYADGSGALLERSVSAGFAHYSSDAKGVFGLGLNWGRPNREMFGTDVRDQYTLEAYYRLQVVDNLAVTPDIQLIKNPALNTDDDFVWVAGFRARLAF